MEYLPKSLKQLLASGTVMLHEQRILSITFGIAQGMKYLHNCLVIHRVRILLLFSSDELRI